MWDAVTGELLYVVGENAIGYHDDKQTYSKPNYQSDEPYNPSIDGAILSKDHSKVITFNAQFNICVWDIATNNLLFSFPDTETPNCPMSNEQATTPPWENEEKSEIWQFITDENLLARMIRYFQTPQYYTPTSSPKSYRISPNNTYLSLYTQTSLMMWNGQTYELLFNQPSEKYCAGGRATLALNNTRIITQSQYGNSICIWDVETQSVISI
ncbi:MAG TPA: hypothetical protein PLZ51_21990, partial [Aggregatilineales bacterium]|nr:hypothetical protein [Aggregatilineales bacterium]